MTIDSRATFVRRLVSLALYSLAVRPAPEEWPFNYRRIDRTELFPVVADVAATRLPGKPVSRQEVNAAVATVARLGPVTIRTTNRGSGTDLLVSLDDREPGDWDDYLAEALLTTPREFAEYAATYGFDLISPVALDELKMTPRERGSVETVLRHAGPRVCARCKVTKEPEAFQWRTGTLRRQSYCLTCQTAATRPAPRPPRPRRSPEARPVALRPVLDTPTVPLEAPLPAPQAETPAALTPVAEAPQAPATPPDAAVWRRHVTYSLARAYDRCEVGKGTTFTCSYQATDAERIDEAGPWHENNARAVCRQHRRAA